MPTNQNPPVPGGNDSLAGVRRRGKHIVPESPSQTQSKARGGTRRSGIVFGIGCAVIASVLIGGLVWLKAADPSGLTSLGVIVVTALAVLTFDLMDDYFPKAPGGDAQKSVVRVRAALWVLIAVLVAVGVALVVAVAV